MAFDLDAEDGGTAWREFLQKRAEKL